MYLPPKALSAHSLSHNLRRSIHSAGEEFWELSLDVGDKRNLFSFVSKESRLLNSFDIPDSQANLRRNGIKKFIFCTCIPLESKIFPDTVRENVGELRRITFEGGAGRVFISNVHVLVKVS